jgi:mannosyltransferase
MPRRTFLGLAGLTALAALLRFPTLDVQSFWLDEAFTALLVREDFGDMLSGITETESTPPLYYVAAWLWSKLFGGWEVGLRSLSALLGTATVPVAYAIGRRLATPRVGLAAAALTAVNPLLVWYSQEARAYALLVLLSAVSLLFFLGALEGRRRELAWWSVTAALALATHYFAAFLVIPEAVWLLVAARRLGRVRPALAAVAAPTVAGAALLPLLLDQASDRLTEFIEGTSLPTRVAQVPKQFAIGFDAPLEELLGVVALALAACGGWLLATRADAEERRAVPILLALAAAGIAVPLVLAVAGADYLLTRNLIAAWIPLALLAAAGFGARSGGRLAVGALTALCTLSAAVVAAVAVEPRFHRSDWRGAAEALGPPPRDRAIVVDELNAEFPLRLYMERVSLVRRQVTIAEIATLSVAAPDAGSPRLPQQQSYPGFTEVERETDERVATLRLQAQAAVELPEGEFGHFFGQGASYTLLVQRAPP